MVTFQVTSEEIKESLVVSEATEANIDKARGVYRPAAQRAALLFFSINDLAKVRCSLDDAMTV